LELTFFPLPIALLRHD